MISMRKNEKVTESSIKIASIENIIDFQPWEKMEKIVMKNQIQMRKMTMRMKKKR